MNFADQITNTHPRVASYLKLQAPILLSNTLVSLKFHNSAQLEAFKQKVEHDLVSFLRTELKNDLISLELSLAQSDEIAKPKHYTDSDKLKHMIEKNPSLLKLKQDFNLDFD